MYRSALIAATLLVGLTSVTVRAEDQSSLLLTDVQIVQVSQRCVQVQSILFDFAPMTVCVASLLDASTM